MKLRRKNAGFSLIELVISTAILSVAGIAMAGLLISAARGWSDGTARENTSGATTLALNKLSAEIRDGASATVSGDFQTLSVHFFGTITDAASNEVIYDPSNRAGIITRTYFVSNGNLVREEGGYRTVLARGLTSARFHASDGLVTVVIKSTEKTASKKAVELEINGRVNLRNYRP